MASDDRTARERSLDGALACVWPPCVLIDGPAAGWRWGEGGEADEPSRRRCALRLRVGGPEGAPFEVSATSLEGPVDGRLRIELRASPSELSRLLSALRREVAAVPLPEDRGLATLTLGGTAWRFDLLDALVALTPSGEVV